MIWIFLFAVLIRLVLSAVSFHPDIQAFNVGGWVVSQGNLLNLYDYIASLPQNNLIAQNYPAGFFIYPPLVYFFHGIFAFLFNNILHLSFGGLFLVDIPKSFGNWSLNLHLLLLKLPYLIFDLPIALLLAKLFQTKRNQNLAMILWLFNPISIYATYLMGQFDIIPTFFVILALYLVVTNKRLPLLKNNTWAAIALGLGASFKIYPLFLLIPLASLENSWINKIRLIILGGAVYLLTILPFLTSSGFRSSALVSNLTLKSFYSQIPVSGGESIILFLMLVVFFYILFINFKGGTQLLWQRFFIILLLFFTFTHYHPQWFLWITPFLIIDLVKSNFKNILPLAAALFSFVALLFFFDPGLTLGLFAPIAPNLYNLPSVWRLLNINIDYNFFRSIFQTLFVGGAFYYIYNYFPKDVKSET